jgi:hypothetical protein
MTDNKESTKYNTVNEETVILSKEDILKEKLASEKGLMESGAALQKIKFQKKNRENVYSHLKEYLRDNFIEYEFNTDSLNVIYNEICDKYPTKYSKQSGLSLMINGDELKKLLYSMVYIHIQDLILLEKEKQCKEIEDWGKDNEEMADEYLRQIEELEAKKPDEKLKNRIIKLRQKCINKNYQIKILYFITSFLTYLNLIGFNNFLWQLNFIGEYTLLSIRLSLSVVPILVNLLITNPWLIIVLLVYMLLTYMSFLYLERLEFKKNKKLK